MFKHFMGAAEDAPVWDFAYAAGLITRAEADLMNGYENGGRAPWVIWNEEESSESNEPVPLSPEDSNVGPAS